MSTCLSAGSGPNDWSLGGFLRITALPAGAGGNSPFQIEFDATLLKEWAAATLTPSNGKRVITAAELVLGVVAEAAGAGFPELLVLLAVLKVVKHFLLEGS